MRRVLVTGANGFIGRHTLNILKERDFDVHAVTSKTHLPTDVNFNWHTIDLLDYGQVRALMQETQPTHLLHFAWDTTPGRYWISSDNFRWVQASLELLLQFRRYGGQRIVMAGTCAEYSWKDGFCSEFTTPTSPITPYGICKNSLQSMLGAYSAQSGLSSAWGRIFFLYGPHEAPERLIPSVVYSLLKGKPARCTHGNQIREFLHVRDAADAFVALLESKVSGPVNISSGKPVTLKDIIYMVADKLNRRDLVQLGVIEPPKNEPKRIVADTQRLNNEVGWVPKINLDRGLDQTILWWRRVLGDKREQEQ